MVGDMSVFFTYCMLYNWYRNETYTDASAPTVTGMSFYAEIHVIFGAVWEGDGGVGGWEGGVGGGGGGVGEQMR